MNCSQCGISLQQSQKFCTHCGNKNDGFVLSESPAPMEKKRKYIPQILLTVVLFAGVIYFALTLTRNYHPVIADQPSVGFGTTPGSAKITSRLVKASIDKNDIIVTVETLTNNGLIRFFDPEGVQTVPIIAYVTPRGKIVTAMSSSESCQSKDFYLEGYNIHCASCPSYWHMESLEAYACCQKYYPDPIPSEVERGVLRIRKEVVRNWRTRI